jgi:hypothetical protein
MTPLVLVGLIAFAWSSAPNLTRPLGALNPQVTQANVNQTICQERRMVAAA